MSKRPRRISEATPTSQPLSARKRRRYRSPFRSDGFAVAPALVVLYEDKHCLAVSKPAGTLTAGDRTGDVTLMDLARRYIRDKYGKPGNVYLGLVHRLDRPVSGVVLFARTSRAAARLSEQFRTGHVRKLYLAWVEGAPDPAAGSMSDFLVKDRLSNVSRTVSKPSRGTREAVLDYRTLKRTSRGSLLQIEPRTGRSHQIRVQLASRGVPIIGDFKYGARSHRAGRIALHASELSFEHPVRGEVVTVRDPEPLDWP